MGSWKLEGCRWGAGPGHVCLLLNCWMREHKAVVSPTIFPRPCIFQHVVSHLPGSRSWLAFKDIDGKFPMGLAATNVVQEELRRGIKVCFGGPGFGGALGGCCGAVGSEGVGAWEGVGMGGGCGPGVAGGDGGV